MVAEFISIKDNDKIEEQCENTEDNNVIIARRNRTSDLYQAIKNQKLDDVKLILQDKKFVNAPLFTSGPSVGYTPLHVACMGNNENLVKLLVEDYRADVNIIAEDGSQPIHLACLFRNNNFVIILLAANANIEAEIRRDFFLKYFNAVWDDDFEEKMTILTYNVVTDNPRLAKILLDNNANIRIENRKNKTLLMYALQMNSSRIVETILRKIGDPEYINARDDDGYYTLSYLFHPIKYGNFRYDSEQIRSQHNILVALTSLLSFKPDIYATVNGDPSTLLLNMAAYRSCGNCLKMLLASYDHLEMSKALYYATLPPEDPQKTLRLHRNQDEQLVQSGLERQRKLAIEEILKVLINRLTFGLPVPEEEKKLMEKLIETDKDIRELVYNYQRNFIHGELKNILIPYGDKSMTYYDFISRTVDRKKSQLLARNEIFMKAYYESGFNFASGMDHLYFIYLCSDGLDNACRRIELLEKLKTVEHLRKAIPLSYECVLEIIEYLNNKDLETFINSFYDM